MVTTGGTLMFIAPELLLPLRFNEPSSRPTQPADIYALGLVIYGVLTGSQPFHEKKWREHELIYHVMTGVRPTKPTDAEQIGFGDGTWELLEECWIEKPTERPTINRVLIHLMCVAANSGMVGPTPDKSRGSSSRLFISPSPTTLTSMHKVKYDPLLVPMRRVMVLTHHQKINRG